MKRQHVLAERLSNTWHTMMPDRPVHLSQFKLWVQWNGYDVTGYGIGEAFKKSLTDPTMSTQGLLAWGSAAMIRAKKKLQRRDDNEEGRISDPTDLSRCDGTDGGGTQTP